MRNVSSAVCIISLSVYQGLQKFLLFHDHITLRVARKETAGFGEIILLCHPEEPHSLAVTEALSAIIHRSFTARFWLTKVTLTRTYSPHLPAQVNQRDACYRSH